jgi:uncharacterized protein (TIGR02246 family)
MKTLSMIVCMAAYLSLAAWSFAEEDNAKPFAEVKARVDSYVSAFNDRDVARCAEHWSEAAEYVVPNSGQRIQGRRAIHDALQRLLKTKEQFELSISNQRMRQVSADVVIEEGTAILVSASHGREQATYLAVYVKQDGKWYRDNVRETATAAPPTADAKLGELSWLIGRWQREDDRGTVHVRGEWINNKQFISRTFEIRAADGYELQGTQIIGCDPSSGLIRSWTFDSEGGLEQAFWSRDGERWLVKVSAVLPDGSSGSEQRILTADDDGSVTSEVIEQQVNGRLLPSTGKVTLVRASAE